MTHMQLHLRGLSVENRIVMADALSTEMEDDPSFEQQGSWSWPVLFPVCCSGQDFYFWHIQQRPGSMVYMG